MSAETAAMLTPVEQRTAAISIDGLRLFIAHSHEVATYNRQSDDSMGLSVLAANGLYAAFKKAASHPDIEPHNIERVAEILAQDDKDRETDFLGKVKEVFESANAQETLRYHTEKQRVESILNFQLESD